jgi:hypothetical protein
VRDVLDDEARDRLVQNVVGYVSKGVKEPVLSRVFEYWRNIDADLRKRSRKAFKATSTATTHKHNTPKRPKDKIGLVSLPTRRLDLVGGTATTDHR